MKQIEEIDSDNCCNCMKQITMSEYNFYDCWCEKCRNAEYQDEEPTNFSDYQKKMEFVIIERSLII